MSFANKPLLWLLLVVPPAMAVFFWWSWRARQRLWTQFIQARLLPGLTVGISSVRYRLRHGCLILAAAFLLLALARPQWGFDWQETKQRGLDIVVAIDTSKSMLAEDIAPNRLARAKLAAIDLMQQARSDRLGLVAFAGSAFLQCPLTIDDSAFRQSVDALDVNIISEGGTALAAAIETALTAFKEGENYKTLVLLSDGEDQDSGALDAAKKAAEAGLHIFTIGIGSADGELLRIRDAKGRTDYIRDDQGNVVKSRLNENLLREIATESRGFYLPLRGAKTIETLYEQGLAPLPKSESSEKLVRQYHERYHWPLAIAMLLLVMEMLLPERPAEPKAKPAGTVPVRARARAGAAAALLLLLACPAAAPASPASALREYEAGKYDQALKEYERLLEKRSDDPRLHFNAGAAAYRNRDFQEATKQFNEALNSPDLNLQGRAYYNRGNSLFHIGEALPDPKAKTGAWEKSLKDYQSARKLNPQDADASFNYEFVKRKLEELKQQQQQQNKSDKNDDQNKDPNQDQQQQQQTQDQKDQQDNKDQQQQQPQPKPDQDQASQDQKKQDQQKQDQEQQQQQAANQSQDQKDKDQQKKDAQSSAQAGEKSDDQNDAEDQKAYALGQMTPEQARQLLDAEKNEEKLLTPKPDQRHAERSRPIKDW